MVDARDLVKTLNGTGGPVAGPPTFLTPTTHEPPMPQTSAKPEPRDFRQEVTENIVKLLEEGVAPWQKPWNGATFMPMNHTTQKLYKGGNALYLMIVAMRRGYEDPRWMTYRQAAERNWQVRKGEKGAQVEFWEIRPGAKPTAKEEASPEEGDEAETPGRPRRFIHRVYTVFNAVQIEGVPALAIRPANDVEAVEAADAILSNSGATIKHDQIDKAFYSRLTDEIHLPRRTFFKDAGGYYGTALHELAHWTGHPERLNRATLLETYSFGDQNYAKEELRAELASLFLAAERGIPHDPERHAAYVGAWIKSLKDDKNEIFRAAHDASAAAEYLLALERGQVRQEASEAMPDSHAERIAREARSKSRSR